VSELRGHAGQWVTEWAIAMTWLMALSDVQKFAEGDEAFAALLTSNGGTQPADAPRYAHRAEGVRRALNSLSTAQALSSIRAAP
jgi:hypothetical protein